MKLWEIADQIESILALEVDPETGEIRDEAAKQLDDLTMDLQAKSVNVALYLKGERTEADAILAEAARLEKRGKIHLNRARWLENYLGKYLGEHSPEFVYEDARLRIAWSGDERAQLIEGFEPTDLEDEFLRVKITNELDKTAAKKAIKAGREVRGVEIVKSKKLKVE